MPARSLVLHSPGTYVLLAALWALLAGCLAAPEPEAWLAVGHRTPEQTFRTFQTALRADEPDLEYRSLGHDFKRRNGVTQLGYREFRRELFSSRPWLKLAARAEIREVRELAPGRVLLVAEVDTWFHDETFALELVREDYYELYAAARPGEDEEEGGARVDDDFAPWSRIARAEEGTLVVRVPLPEDLDVREVGELRAGHEWKIDGFPMLGEAPTPEP
jgi:hypothetical protein